MTTKNSCAEFVVEPTDGHPNFRFIGCLVAKVSSERNNARYWTELEAYKTRAGKWIIVTIGGVNEALTDYERRVSIMVFEDEAKMTAKIGYGRLSAKLYQKLELEEIFVA